MMESPSGAVFPPYLIHHKQALPSQISSGREVFFLCIEYAGDILIFRTESLNPLTEMGFCRSNRGDFASFGGAGGISPLERADIRP
jgi:hypothetical protein